MLLLLPTRLASSLPWPGLALVARGGQTAKTQCFWPHLGGQERGPNSPAFFVLTGSTQSPCPHRELLGTKSMATPYLSHWALWPGTLHLACQILLTPRGSAALMPTPWLSVLPSLGRTNVGHSWELVSFVVTMWCPQAQILRGTSVPDSLLNWK